MKTLFLATILAASASAFAAPLPTLEVPRTASAFAVSDFEPKNWKNAVQISQLPLSLGSDARDKEFPTTVKLQHDGAFFWVRFDAPQIYAPFDSPARDQNLWEGDAVELFFDAAGDGKAVVEMQLSPKNQVFDQQILLSTEPKSDEFGKLRDDVLSRDFWTFASWNCNGLETATAQTPRGWMAQWKIPAAPILRRLGLQNWGGQTVRAHLMRYSHVPDETAKNAAKRRLVSQGWAKIKHGCPHISPAAMGFLRFAR